MKASRKSDHPKVPANGPEPIVHKSDPLAGKKATPISTAKPLRGGVCPVPGCGCGGMDTRAAAGGMVMIKGIDLQRGIDHLLAAHRALDSMGIDFVGVNTARTELINAAQSLRDAGVPTIGGSGVGGGR